VVERKDTLSGTRKWGEEMRDKKNSRNLGHPKEKKKSDKEIQGNNKIHPA